MTVQELIDKLDQIKDKEKPVKVADYFFTHPVFVEVEWENDFEDHAHFLEIK